MRMQLMEWDTQLKTFAGDSNISYVPVTPIMKAFIKEVSDPKFFERMSYFQCVIMGVSMSKTDERKKLARGYKKVM